MNPAVREPSTSAALLRDMVVSVPIPSQGGGVIGLWQTIQDELPCSVHLYVVGRRTVGESWARKTIRSVADTWRLVRLADRRRSDLVVLNPSLDPKSLIRDGVTLLALRARGRRAFVFIHGWDPAVAATIHGLRRRLFLVAYGRAAGIAVLATEFHRRLRAWGYRGPVAVVTTVAPVPLSQAPDERPRWVPGTALRLLFMARLIPSKGLDSLVRACALLQEDGVPVSLVVAGVGPEREPAERLATELGLQSASFVGDVSGSGKHAVLTASDVFVLPSTHGEGMPVALLEAMTYSLAVVTTAVGGLADLLRDGIDCLLLESDAPGAVADSLRRLAGDPALLRRLGDEARDEADRFFMPDVVAARLARLFAQAARGTLEADYFWFATEASGGSPEAR